MKPSDCQDRIKFIQEFSFRRDEAFAKELFGDVLQALSHAHQSDYQKLIVLTNAPERSIRILSRKIDFNSLKSLSVKTIEILNINQVNRVALEVELSQSTIPVLVVESFLNGVDKQILQA